MTKKSKTYNWRLWLTVGAIVIFGTVALVLQGLTMVAGMKVWGPAIAVGLAAGAYGALNCLKRGVASKLHLVLSVLGTAAATTTAVGCLIFGVNYYGRHTSQATELHATVTAKYTKTRTRNVGTGRRFSRGGHREKYKVYYITAELPDGRSKDFQLTLSRYNSIKSGKPIAVTLTPGLLGMDVVELRK